MHNNVIGSDSSNEITTFNFGLVFIPDNQTTFKLDIVSVDSKRWHDPHP